MLLYANQHATHVKIITKDKVYESSAENSFSSYVTTKILKINHCCGYFVLHSDYLFINLN